MDNKRWYSRFGTIFWWSLAILPLIVALIQFIGFHLTFNSGITSATELANYHANSNGDFIQILSYYLNYAGSTFFDFQLSFIYDMFFALFQQLNMDQIGLYSMATLFGWMTSVAFYHVLFDFAVWIFNWIHSFFERWGCFK